ncbi:hypothetical protein SMC26_15485 [Actinomadura fulvescens]|uniref:hypothetical protein n=1 Tax=Actinomadura fulvescens TaxID=46160 RepID=UPI0031E1BC3B
MSADETSTEGFTFRPAEEMDGREGIVAIGRVGGWEVRAWWPPGEHGGPRDLHIVPAEDAQPRDLGRGITTGTLRSIPLARLAVKVRELGPSPYEPTWDADDPEMKPRPEDDRYLLGGALDVITEHVNADPNPGRRGRPDIFHVAVAHAYAGYAETGYPNPVQMLAEATGVGRRTASNWVVQARAAGMLTQATERQPGGALSDKAISLMEQMIKPKEGN